MQASNKSSSDEEGSTLIAGDTTQEYYKLTEFGSNDSFPLLESDHNQQNGNRNENKDERGEHIKYESEEGEREGEDHHTTRSMYKRTTNRTNKLGTRLFHPTQWNGHSVLAVLFGLSLGLVVFLPLSKVATKVVSKTASLTSSSSSSSSSFLSSYASSSKLAPSQGKGEQRFVAPLCSIEEYNNGAWYPRDLAFSTIQDFKDLFHIHQNPTSPRDIGCKFKEGDDPDLNLRRTFNVTGYKWLPHSGCELIEVTRAKLLRYLLRAPAGLMLIGDSLTDEHMFALNNLLLYPGGPIYSNPPGGDWLQSSLYLNASHPEAAYVLAAAGVPIERASQPLVVYNRDDLLIPHGELANLFREMGVPISPDLSKADPALGSSPHFWLSLWAVDHPRWYTDLQGWMTTELMFPDDPAKVTSETWPSGVKKEQSIVLVSVGAHWSPQGMGGISIPEIYTAYNKMLQIMLPRFEGLQPYVQTFFRATSPGHESCGMYFEPDPTRVKQANPEFRHDQQQYHWFMIEVLNNMLKDELDRRAPSWWKTSKNLLWKSKATPAASSSSTSNPSEKGKGSIKYLDMWSIANQRPDIHRQPPLDCLHVCGSVLETEWTKLLWHAVKLGAKNRAEDGAWPNHPYQISSPAAAAGTLSSTKRTPDSEERNRRRSRGFRQFGSV